MQRAKVIALLLATAVLAYIISTHLALNGSRLHPWVWRRGGAFPLYPLVLASAVPFFAAQSLFPRRRKSALALLMLSCLSLQLVFVSLQVDHLKLGRIAFIVQSPAMTSYFTDARQLLDEGVTVPQLLATYPQRMAGFHMHAQEKPPGPILYYMTLLRLFPSDYSAAMAGGLLIGLLATLCIPATYALVNLWTKDTAAAFFAAAYLALCPGLLNFLPEFDQTYPLLACALLITWTLALRTQRIGPAIAFGILLSLTCFMAYNLLVLGAFLALYSLVTGWRSPRLILSQTAVALATVFLLYLLLFIATGFRPIATFLTALQNQRHLLTQLNRPWPATIPTDLLDFVLGSAFLSALLILFYFLTNRLHLRLVILALAQPLIVALTGLLQAETARVWTFMLPLLVLPISLELRTWSRLERNTAFACVLILVTLMNQHMRFH